MTRPQGSSLGVETNAEGLPVIPASDHASATSLAEPHVATGSPSALGDVVAPSDGSGTSYTAASGSPAIPNTGQPQHTPPGPPADDTLAAIPPPQNQPPTLQNPLDGKLEAVQGQAVNVRLGTFGDEEGPAGLRLDVQGTIPGGVGLRLTEGGVAQLDGTPAEYGDFDLRVAAVDPQGLVSRPITVTLSVTPSAANRNVRDYILGYDGGDCFLSQPVELGPKLARIEVFAPEARLQPVLDFDAAFKRDMGFEANIGMRPISEKQCTVIHDLDQVAPQALDNSLAIALDHDELAAGDTLSGTIKSGEGARLYLLDHAGGLTDLSEFVKAEDGAAGFSVPISAAGPQILIAAKPRDGAGVAPKAGLEALLAAARRGQASLAIGFFFMKADARARTVRARLQLGAMIAERASAWMDGNPPGRSCFDERDRAARSHADEIGRQAGDGQRLARQRVRRRIAARPPDQISDVQIRLDESDRRILGCRARSAGRSVQGNGLEADLGLVDDGQRVVAHVLGRAVMPPDFYGTGHRHASFKRPRSQAADRVMSRFQEPAGRSRPPSAIGRQAAPRRIRASIAPPAPGRARLTTPAALTIR